DADVTSRAILSFLKGGINDDGSAWIQINPVDKYGQRPQLMNIPLAIWDTYLINRDFFLLEEAYPILVKQQNWIDTKWNIRPNGPIADLDWNIDYGSALHNERHLWVDMTAFQVSQYMLLA